MDGASPTDYRGGVNVVRATLALYLRALQRAARALVKAPVSLVGLLVAQGALLVTAIVASPLGIIGGFIVGFVAAAASGAYLSLVEASLQAPSSLGWSALRTSIGRYLWDVINVMFIFWIASLFVTELLSPTLQTLLWLVVFLLFNPVPEMIYRRGSTGGIETLSAAFRWIQGNWPEWFFPHALVGLAIWLVQPSAVLTYLQAFGPRFGFIQGVSAVQSFLALAAGGLFSPRLVAMALLVPVGTHGFMLFRGALYDELNRASRRARAWQARL